MTVRELIDVLSRLDGDKQVFVSDERTNWSDDVVVQTRNEISIWDEYLSRITTHHNVVVVL